MSILVVVLRIQRDCTNIESSVKSGVFIFLFCMYFYFFTAMRKRFTLAGLSAEEGVSSPPLSSRDGSDSDGDSSDADVPLCTLIRSKLRLWLMPRLARYYKFDISFQPDTCRKTETA